MTEGAGPCGPEARLFGSWEGIAISGDWDPGEGSPVAAYAQGASIYPVVLIHLPGGD